MNQSALFDGVVSVWKIKNQVLVVVPCKVVDFAAVEPIDEFINGDSLVGDAAYRSVFVDPQFTGDSGDQLVEFTQVDSFDGRKLLGCVRKDASSRVTHTHGDARRSYKAEAVC